MSPRPHSQEEVELAPATRTPDCCLLYQRVCVRAHPTTPWALHRQRPPPVCLQIPSAEHRPGHPADTA